MRAGGGGLIWLGGAGPKPCRAGAGHLAVAEDVLGSTRAPGRRCFEASPEASFEHSPLFPLVSGDAQCCQTLMDDEIGSPGPCAAA